MSEYANTVLRIFSPYWDTLSEISSYLKAVEKESQKFDLFGLCGKVHGCIVDLDIGSHIYVNPYDGTVTPYYADSKKEKYVYKNVESLISSRCPEFLDSYAAAMSGEPMDLLYGSELTGILPPSESGNGLSLKYEDLGLDISTECEFSEDTYIYRLSNKFLNLQRIYEEKRIVVWYEDFVSSLETDSGTLSETAFKSLGEAEND